MPPGRDAFTRITGKNPLAAGAERRRASFGSADEARAQLRSTHPHPNPNPSPSPNPNANANPNPNPDPNPRRADDHHMHHAFVKCNYSPYSVIWDKAPPPSPLDLPYVSPLSPLYLPYISLPYSVI